MTREEQTAIHTLLEEQEALRIVEHLLYKRGIKADSMIAGYIHNLARETHSALRTFGKQ